MSPISTPRPALTVAPEDVPAKMDDLSAAIRAHRELLRHIGAVFGEAVGERLLRSLEKVDDASDRVDYGIMSLRREGEDALDEANRLADICDEVAKVLDVQTMHQARIHANRYLPDRDQKPDVTLVEAAEFNRDERVRLFEQVQIARTEVAVTKARGLRTIDATMAGLDVWASWAVRKGHTARQVGAVTARAVKAMRAAQAADHD